MSLPGFEVDTSVRTVSVLARIWSGHLRKDSHYPCQDL